MKTSGFSALSRRRKKQFILTLLILLFSGMLLYFSITRSADLLKRRTAKNNQVISISELWDDQRYSKIVDISEQRLAIDPMDKNALLFAGYSRYFLALSRLSSEQRNFELDLCIRHLRKLLASGDDTNKARIQYILGKAYLGKGPFWSDLALKYLTLTLESGYMPEDLYEYLGRASSSAGKHEAAFEWYDKAAKNYPTDRLLLTLGEESFRLARYDDAAEYYRSAISLSQDDTVIKRGLSQLGKLYYDVKNYEMAKGVLENLVSMDSTSENGLFLLAETYHELGRESDARIFWHKVVRLNSRHIGALRRLYD